MCEEKKRSTSLTRESQEKIIEQIVSVERHLKKLLAPIEKEIDYWKSITANLPRWVMLEEQAEQIKNHINSLEEIIRELNQLR